MIFGIGIGICVSIAVLFVVYIVQRQAYFNRIDELNERIFQLENFILYGDEDEGGGSAPIIIQPSTTPAETTPATEYEDTTEAETEAATEAETEAETTAQAQTVPETTTPQLPPPSALGVWVHIPANIAAYEIARILYDSGVVVDFNDFMNFLINNGFTTSLMAGNYLLPIDGDFEVIMRSILAGGL